MLELRHALAISLSLGLWSTACFDDPVANNSSASSSNDSNTSETGGDDGACPTGSAGCDCYGNSTCDAGLECDAETCKLPECVAGSLNCDCYEGVCLTGLICADGVCKPDEPDAGCESVADCDDNLCTQGDSLCEDTCKAGIEVQCPIGATCEASSGSCECGPGTKVCGNECIAETQCCTDRDCAGASTCADGFCTCEGGLDCDGLCIVDAACCPGETSSNGCTCGGVKTCTPEGVWSPCMGANPSPQCAPGQTMACGNCGQKNCNAQCNWTTCQGGGVCTPGTETCTNECKFEVCQPGCYWQNQGMCC